MASYMRDFVPGNSIDDGYKAFLGEYCKYDSIRNAEIVDDLVFKDIKKDAMLYKKDEQDRKSYNVIIASNLCLERDDTVKEMFESLGPDDLLVFDHGEFCDWTGEQIRRYAEPDIRYVLAAGNTPMTLPDKIAIAQNRKYGWHRKKVARLYRDELKRILPGIDVKSIRNLTNQPLYEDLERVLNEDAERTLN